MFMIRKMLVIKTITIVLVLSMLSTSFLGCVDTKNFDTKELDVDIQPSFSKGLLSLLKQNYIKPSDDKTTLQVKITSNATYEDIRIHVSIPTADNLNVSPIDVNVDKIGAGESRNLNFVITSSGQGEGSYFVVIKVYDENGMYDPKEQKIKIFVSR